MSPCDLTTAVNASRFQRLIQPWGLTDLLERVRDPHRCHGVWGWLLQPFFLVDAGAFESGTGRCYCWLGVDFGGA
jgi:hypothetical protein